MNRLSRFASAPVDSFDLVADMPVVVFLGQLCRGTIRGPAHLRSEFISFLLRPFMAQVAYFNVQLAELLIDLQVFDFHVRLVHSRLLFCEIGFSTPQWVI
jgi:hypothetical protein